MSFSEQSFREKINNREYEEFFESGYPNEFFKREFEKVPTDDILDYLKEWAELIGAHPFSVEDFEAFKRYAIEYGIPEIIDWSAPAGNPSYPHVKFNLKWDHINDSKTIVDIPVVGEDPFGISLEFPLWRLDTKKIRRRGGGQGRR